MADLPSFLHIHCSSRFDRSPESLEYDLDNWMADASLITVTEVTNNARAARLREKGWGYYNAKSFQDADNCAIAWETATWHRVSGKILKLSANTFDRLHGMQNVSLWAATVVLRHTQSGHRLLVSCTHMPAHIEGPDGWRHNQGWEARKRAVMTGLTNWSTHVDDMTKKQKIDAQLIVADWNINLKADWWRQILMNHWGSEYQIAWKDMPTEGGSLHGGPKAPSNDSPGKGHHDRIIDGSLYNGLKVTKGPTLMPRVRSSDHRPYQETFKFDFFAGQPGALRDKKKARSALVGDNASVYVPGYGDVFHGEAWWGFGDYMDDEAYFTPAQEPSTGEAGGEVL
jgi:hypothetical protein